MYESAYLCSAYGIKCVQFTELSCYLSAYLCACVWSFPRYRITLTPTVEENQMTFFFLLQGRVYLRGRGSTTIMIIVVIVVALMWRHRCISTTINIINTTNNNNNNNNNKVVVGSRVSLLLLFLFFISSSSLLLFSISSSLAVVVVFSSVVVVGQTTKISLFSSPPASFQKWKIIKRFVQHSVGE